MSQAVDTRLLDQWSRMHLTLTSDRLRHLLDKVIHETQQCLDNLELDARTADRLDAVARATGQVRQEINELALDLAAHAES